MDKKLRKAVKKAGNQSKLAKVSNVSRAFISQMALKQRPIPDSYHAFLDEYLAQQPTK
jgi:DNA-binding transcriptional regulator YdaS (Cro superfamily)